MGGRKSMLTSRAARRLIVQPRLHFSTFELMRWIFERKLDNSTPVSAGSVPNSADVTIVRGDIQLNIPADNRDISGIWHAASGNGGRVIQLPFENPPHEFEGTEVQPWLYYQTPGCPGGQHRFPAPHIELPYRLDL